MRGGQRRDGLTSGRAEFDQAARRARIAETAALGHARSGGAPIARRWRGFGPTMASMLRTAAWSAGAYMAWAWCVAHQVEAAR
jgi:hypothetical protein